jgi:hypothetical protein
VRLSSFSTLQRIYDQRLISQSNFYEPAHTLNGRKLSNFDDCFFAPEPQANLALFSDRLRDRPCEYRQRTPYFANRYSLADVCSLTRKKRTEIGCVP